MAKKDFSSQLVVDETFDLRGLNLIAPDQVMPEGETPYARNSRMYARDDDEARVAIRTRKGSKGHTTPVGETINAQNAAVATGDLEFTTDKAIAFPFTPSATGPLSRLNLIIKRGANAYGHARIYVYTDNGGSPGTEISDTSILADQITDTYKDLPAYLMDAPKVTAATTYWFVINIQDNGSGSYYLQHSANTGALTTLDEGTTWSPALLPQYKTYLATDAPVKGFTQRYPSTGENRTLFAAGNTLHSVNALGTVTAVSTAIDANSYKVRMDTVDDKTFYVDGVIAPRWWDGTTDAPIANAPTGAENVIIWQNRAFFLLQKTLVKYSALYAFEEYPAVNFFYVPRPKSSDHVAGWIVFQDGLLIFTHETKYAIYGSDVSTFTRRDMTGTKGAVSQEAIAADRNAVYFMADDGHIYAWNGADDKLLSRSMEPEFQSIPNKKDVRIHLYRNQIRVYYSKVAGQPNDRMAVYDIETKQWFIDTGRAVVGSLELSQDNNELLEFSSRVGWLFRGEEGYSDVGKAIDWEYRTRYNIYGSGSSLKRVKRFRPYIRTTEQDYTMLVGKDMDYEDDPDMREYVVASGGAKWGSFVWGDGTKFGGGKKMIDERSSMSGRGKHIQYRFKRRGVETPVELLGYFAQVKVGRPR